MSLDPGWTTAFFEGPLAKALTPLSWVYGAAALARRRWRSRSAVRLERPVISVGNITCGGTGKTPFVEMLARDLSALGRKPAILSRGYGARQSVTPDGARVNDEYLVLRSNLPDVPHLQGKDRISIGRAAIKDGADVLILDDGFQHVRLERDTDIVLIDATSPFGGAPGPFGQGRVLPAGLLREPLEALEEASLFGITRSDQVAPRTLTTLCAYLRNRFPGTPQMTLVTHPIEWVGLGGSHLPLEALSGQPALAFCGIGNPESFRRQILALGVDLRAFVPFRDHHAYNREDIANLRSRMLKSSAVEIVMTQKDAVKIKSDETTASWKHLSIATRIQSGESAYREALRTALERQSPHAT